MSDVVTPIGDQRSIDRDVPCAACGYNLRTLPGGGRCPECRGPVVVTLRAHARRLAGADRRWLRALTSAMAWFVLASTFPIAAALVGLPERALGAWATADRLTLAVILAPAVFGLAACWRLGSAAPARAGGDRRATRWALRGLAVAWFVPLLWVAGPFSDELRSPDSVFLVLMSWGGLLATALFFRRLTHVLRRVPAKFTAAACAAVGWQLPLALVVAAAAFEGGGRGTPEAQEYAIATPMPAAGLPWVAPMHGLEVWDHLWASGLDFEFRDVSIWYVSALLVAVPLLAVHTLIVLIRVRRQDPSLPAYCAAWLASSSDGEEEEEVGGDER